jgi:HEAT repeat protein
MFLAPKRRRVSMQQIWNWRLGMLCRAGVTVLLLLSLVPAAWARRAYRDPVDELRQALQSRRTDRTERVKELAQKLTTVGDLRRALLLPGWKPEDRAVERQIAKLLTEKLRKALRSGDALTRRAAADLIWEIGGGIAPPGADPRGTLITSLTPDLVRLLERDSDLLVRQAAARTLGRTHSGPREIWRLKDKKARLEIEPGEAIPALEAVLNSSQPASLRQAAARGLYGMVRSIPESTKVVGGVTADKQRVGGTYTGVEAMAVCWKVIPVVIRGINDPDPGVRLWCARTIRQVAQQAQTDFIRPLSYEPIPDSLVDEAVGSMKKDDKENDDKEDNKDKRNRDKKNKKNTNNDNDDDLDRPKPSKRGQFEAEARREGVRFGEDLKGKVAGALAGAGKVLARHLSDSNRRVRLQVRRALIELADVRRKILRPADYNRPTPGNRKTQSQGMSSKRRSVFDVAELRPAVLDSDREQRLIQVVQANEKSLANDLLDGLLPSVEVLARGLTDPRLRDRLDSLLFLELMEEKARPAAPAIIRAMHDSNPFVRWAAARTLGKIRASEDDTPPLPNKAVPVLASLLKDSDIDVRMAASRTLDLYGAKAAGAIGALIYSLKVSDPEVRIAAMHTLLSIGGPTAYKAIPALIALLSSEEAQLRQSAAQTLGRFGKAARSALPALRKLLRDTDGEVRKAATEAVLNIEGE